MKSGLMVGVLVIIAIAFVASVIVFGVVSAPLYCDPHARPSDSIAISRSKGRFHKTVTVAPLSLTLRGRTVEFDEIWIEMATKRKPLFFALSYDEPVGYYFLCFTIKEPEAKKVYFSFSSSGDDAMLFVLNDQGKGFASVNFSELFWTELQEIQPGIGKIYLVTSWREKREVFATVTIE